MEQLNPINQVTLALNVLVIMGGQVLLYLHRIQVLQLVGAGVGLVLLGGIVVGMVV